MDSYRIWQKDDDEYTKLIKRMNPPRRNPIFLILPMSLGVVIDNDVCDNATVITVDSVNKHGSLLQVVQVLTDLNLIVTKAYIASDSNWFLDVFNVTDREGNKVVDKDIISYIEESLETDSWFSPTFRNSVGVVASEEHTAIELSGTDRPGLLSEICAVLANLNCNVVNAAVWTHNTRAAAVVHVTDENTGRAIEDPMRLSEIKKLLCFVLKGTDDSRAAKTAVSTSLTHTERRLHQIMFDDRDYQRVCVEDDEGSRTQVSVLDCTEKDYTVIIVRSKDRPKLLFDIVCTITDMKYVVYHGTVEACGSEAYQEYYIRHIDGHPVSSEAERERVIQCLRAAIERRTSEGLELELRTEDRVGLLSDITRIFRENGLTIRRAEISTEGGKAVDTFYLSEMSGFPLEEKTIESIQTQIGQAVLRVKQNTLSPPKHQGGLSSTSFLFPNFFKGCSLQNLWLIKSNS